MNDIYWTLSPSKRLGRNLFLSICLLLITAGQAQAEGSLSLVQALQRTLADNPELQSYPLALRGAEALQTQASLSPSSVLGIEIENALGTGDFEGLDSAEISLTLSQLIELGDKQASRRRFANAETERLQSEYQLARLDVLAETSRRYYQILYLQAQQAIVDLRLQREQQALLTIRQRAKAGAVGDADVSKMALSYAQTQTLQTGLANQLKVARMRLAAMWLGEVDFDRVAGSLTSIHSLPMMPAIEQVKQSVDHLPGVKHQLALQRLADTQLQLANANGASDLNLGVGLKQHQRSSDQSLTFSFSMPLAFENPNKGRIQAAQASLDLSAQASQWTRQRLLLSLLEIYQQLSGDHDQLALFEKTLLPQAEKLLQETTLGYEKGRYSILQLADAQAEVFNAQLSILGSRYQIYLRHLELERITGQSMTQNAAVISGELP